MLVRELEAQLTSLDLTNRLLHECNTANLEVSTSARFALCLVRPRLVDILANCLELARSVTCRVRVWVGSRPLYMFKVNE
jgi:hypothetical protein